MCTACNITQINNRIGRIDLNELVGVKYSICCISFKILKSPYGTGKLVTRMIHTIRLPLVHYENIHLLKRLVHD